MLFDWVRTSYDTFTVYAAPLKDWHFATLAVCTLYGCSKFDCVVIRSTMLFFFFFSSRRRHTRSDRDWSSDVCSSDLAQGKADAEIGAVCDRRRRGQPAARVVGVCGSPGERASTGLLRSTKPADRERDRKSVV